MDDTEVIERFHNAFQHNRKLIPEEVLKPDYKFWARARRWHVHQAICLLAGLVPLEARSLDSILKAKSPLHYINLFSYYPINPKMEVLLKNISYRLKEAIEKNVISFSEGSEQEKLLKPIDVLNWAKGVEGMIIPETLFDVVKSQGPVNSFEITDTFPDDIRPSVLENRKRWEKFSDNEAKQVSPAALNNKAKTVGAVRSEPLAAKSKIRKQTPDQRQRAQFEAIAKPIIEQDLEISLNDLLRKKDIGDFLASCVDANGDPRNYSDKTLCHWVGKLRKGKIGRPKNS